MTHVPSEGGAAGVRGVHAGGGDPGARGGGGAAAAELRAGQRGPEPRARRRWA